MLNRVQITDGGGADGEWIDVESGYSFAIYGEDAESFVVDYSPYRYRPTDTPAATKYVSTGALTDFAAAGAGIVKTSADTGYEFLDIPCASMRITLTGGSGYLELCWFNETGQG